LGKLADAFLMHNRPIRTRCDDSVMRVFFSTQIKPNSNQGMTGRIKGVQPNPILTIPLRRSRGYAPNPIQLPWESPPLLATGSELKNSFCLAREQYAFLSHYIGDMENYETLQSFEDAIQHYEQLFRVHPEMIAYDLHPNYLATSYAKNRAEMEGLPALGIQHHHAHIAGCMAENHLPDEEAVIGVAFDGTGYGIDGAIWGGEFLIANYRSFQRAAHLEYTPLPGGDAAIRKPARIALAYLWHANLTWEPELPPAQTLCPEERMALRSQLEHGINTHPTSSMGRLFDAVAALVGVRQQVNYEAQAAIELEALVDKSVTEYYPMKVIDLKEAGSIAGIPALNNEAPLQILISPLLEALLQDFHARVPVSIIAARFHNGLAQMVRDVCNIIRTETTRNKIVLSGGVWQNLTLLDKTYRLLVEDGYQIYLHHQTPPNDGGIALGQAAIAAQWLRK
jgi:hydrogenase maturation protein HypF